MSFQGCDPISIRESGNDYLKAAAVLAFIAPDTVEVSETFSVQVGYSDACGSKFERLEVHYDSLRMSYSPVLHIYPTTNCPPANAIHSVRDSPSLPRVGRYILALSGEKGVIPKPIEVVADRIPFSGFSFHFTFTDPKGSILGEHLDSIRFHNGATVTFLTDAESEWDTLIASSATSLRYVIGGMDFEASRGISEKGIIVR